MEQLNFMSLIGVKAFTRYELFEKVAAFLLEKDYVNESYAKAVIEREKVYPTGLPTKIFGVAIPHTDPEHVKRNLILTVVPEKPILFNTMGGEENDLLEVECLFFILVKESNNHIKAVMNFMQVFQNPEDLMTIRQASSKKTIEDILKKYLI
jgi:Phosphotransferase system mannitol/fructose-specific IIA domain (Ntr-type)